MLMVKKENHYTHRLIAPSDTFIHHFSQKKLQPAVLAITMHPPSS